jgi:hypothetical protein
MRLFAIGIEHARVVAVDRLQRGHARQKHPGDLALGRINQDLGRGQNLRIVLLGLGHRPGEIGDGLPQCLKLGAIGQRDRIIEASVPAALLRLQANSSAPAWVNFT